MIGKVLGQIIKQVTVAQGANIELRCCLTSEAPEASTRNNEPFRNVNTFKQQDQMKRGIFKSLAKLSTWVQFNGLHQ